VRKLDLLIMVSSHIFRKQVSVVGAVYGSHICCFMAVSFRPVKHITHPSVYTPARLGTYVPINAHASTFFLRTRHVPVPSDSLRWYFLKLTDVIMQRADTTVDYN